MRRDFQYYSQFASQAIELRQIKWKMRVLCVIRRGPVRLGQLAREIPSASKNVLSENLQVAAIRTSQMNRQGNNKK
jgi:DNA-binding HxlR family transcriptional regulator